MRGAELLDETLVKRRRWTEYYSVRDTLRLLSDSLASLGLQDWALKNDNSNDPLHPEIAVTGTFQISARMIRKRFSDVGLKLGEKNRSWERWVWRSVYLPGHQLDATIQNYGPENYHSPVNTILLKATKYGNDRDSN
jgi:hypothetical protein